MENEWNICAVVGLGYLAAVNLTGFFLMGLDKRRARKKKWRIRERQFFIVSLLLGSAGTWIGMYVFRHKTRHLKFVLGIPGILAAQLIIFICWKFAG